LGGGGRGNRGRDRMLGTRLGWKKKTSGVFYLLSGHGVGGRVGDKRSGRSERVQD